MLVVSGIRIPLGRNTGEAVGRAKTKLGLRDAEIQDIGLNRVSYDARHSSIFLVCSVAATLFDEQQERRLAENNADVAYREPARYAPQPGETPLSGRPVVAGFGPAGIFAALALARAGYAPIVLERGPDADTRAVAVQRFYETGELSEDANVQFGEGGAGAFSDGKLTSRTNDAYAGYIINTLIENGAPRDIAWQAKPHIGTDLLCDVVKSLRAEIIRLGGEVRFLSPLLDIGLKNGMLSSVKTPDEVIETNALVLATGHSARDIFELCAARELPMRQKPFSVGLRIEHLQSDIDTALWGAFAGHPDLPRGEYALSTRYGGRGVYTFCMCPGGSVVAAASERGGVVTNGMSFHARDGKNANAAICVAVDERQLGPGVFAGVDYQRRLEQTAFSLAGGAFKAPAADVGHFMRGERGLDITAVAPSYARGVAPADLGALLGFENADALRFGIAAFSKKLRGFGAAGAILTGPETRTSSPVRIERGEDNCSSAAAGLFPCGEGAGYAGGIMSAAADGLRVAASLIERFKPIQT